MEGEYGRQEACPSCRTDTKVCRNCIHYEPVLNNECREPSAELVTDKAKSNFCEYFKPGSPASQTDPLAKAASAKDAFEKLFKNKG